ncbi:alpha/beta hydrolase [Luteimicrobium xylanilyticum]|uniref:Arylformamidase n=1 Tax=Luteimicrobium xylanilyticum TaxID=1133546 RepID=A0A5P9QE07_9MICO|nr:alpha/beta hydrolase [Luteimicrobium xylanilyticum]QFU99290.1 Arylformamidase [Luteimicrobium xylanilyticum]
MAPHDRTSGFRLTVPAPRRGVRVAGSVVAGGIALGLGVALVAAVAVSVSPWPGALLVRWAFDRGGVQTDKVLAAYAPAPDAVSVTSDVRYAPGPDGTFDVYYPSRLDGTADRLPTVVWSHGGGWLAGTKAGTATWARILADKGYTVVVPDYTLAPAAHYPRQLQQTLDAVAFLHATPPAHVDGDRLFLAGDSAGASLVAQAATVLTHPAYGREVGVNPGATPSSAIRGVLLNCGPYDLGLIDGSEPGLLGWGSRTIGWSYLGERDFLDEPLTKTLSLVDHVYPGFPPVFVSGGNDDPLTAGAKVYAERLAAAGTDVDALFFPGDYVDPASGKALPHEYQFDLRLHAAQTSLDRTLAFLAQHT